MPAGKHEYMSCKVNGSWGACRVSSFFWAFSLRKLSWQALCAKDCAHPACDSFFFFAALSKTAGVLPKLLPLLATAGCKVLNMIVGKDLARSQRLLA